MQEKQKIRIRVIDNRWLELVLRAMYYFRMGFSHYLGFSLTLLNTAMIAYGYVGGLPFFQDFWVFMITLTIAVGCTGMITGYLHLKRIPIYKVEQSIITEANPFTSTRVSPVSLPTYKAWEYWMRKEGQIAIADELKAIIERSEQK